MSKFEELVKQAVAEGTEAKDPTANKPKTKERDIGPALHAAYQSLSEGAEEANVADNVDALDAYLADMGQARRHNKGVIKALFENGTPGKYVTRSQTLIEKTAAVLKK